MTSIYHRCNVIKSYTSTFRSIKSISLRGNKITLENSEYCSDSMALSYFHVLFQKSGEKEFFFLLYNLYILSFDCSPILYINAINIKSRIDLDKTDCGDGDSAQLGFMLV